MTVEKYVVTLCSALWYAPYAATIPNKVGSVWRHIFNGIQWQCRVVSNRNKWTEFFATTARKCLEPIRGCWRDGRKFGCWRGSWKRQLSGRRKSWMRNRKWRSVLSATYVLTFNDEQSWRWGGSWIHQNKTAFWNWQDRDREQTNSLFECLLQDLPELANVITLSFTKIGSTCWKWVELLISSAARRSSSAAVAPWSASTLSCSGLVRSARALCLGGF
jgi:hypothetical protein